jgi:hypothetical protein
VALTEIGVRNGTMLRENAAALVGAGVLTVIVLPALAVALHRPEGTASRDFVGGCGRPPPGPRRVKAPSRGDGDHWSCGSGHRFGRSRSIARFAAVDSRTVYRIAQAHQGAYSHGEEAP